MAKCHAPSLPGHRRRRWYSINALAQRDPGDAIQNLAIAPGPDQPDTTTPKQQAVKTSVLSIFDFDLGKLLEYFLFQFFSVVVAQFFDDFVLFVVADRRYVECLLWRSLDSEMNAVRAVFSCP
jgi:hypothetical protein